MIVDVSDKVVVVTGSSRGIGRAILESFALEGSKVVINYCNSKDSAIDLQEKILQYNKNCIVIQADVTKQNQVEDLYYSTMKAFGRIDVLINNAGICDDNLIQLMPENQWQKVLDVNLTGPYLCSRAFSRAMIRQKSGKIINIASLKGQEGCEGQVNYSAAKAGLIGFTKTLAKELGKFNIAVNAVCSGFVVTDLNRHDEAKRLTAENRSLFPLESVLEDLLNYLIYISSDKFKGISGRIINLDSRL